MANIAPPPDPDPEPSAEVSRSGTQQHLWSWIGVGGAIYLLLVAVEGIGRGFQAATGGQAEQLFQFATQPVLGLMVGILATALLQSSSTVTAIIVGLVAGGLPVALAIPMVMGANLGTSITNTLVSLGHLGKTAAFQRAFAAATVHDFFNLLAVVIFLPLELLCHPLEQVGRWIAEQVAGRGGLAVQNFNVVENLTTMPITLIQRGMQAIPQPWSGLLLIGLGVGLILVAIGAIATLLKPLIIGPAQTLLNTAIGQGPITGIATGTGITLLVQSSSTTTSLMVPLAGSGILSLEQIYPFTLGANIGTCITALLAATTITGPAALPATEIAIIHLLFNTLGVIVIYGTPWLRPLPMIAAQTLATQSAHHKWVGFAYILSVFFLLPGLFLGLSTTL